MRAAGLAAALLCAVGVVHAADLPCPGAVSLQTERDYLVNLKAALRSSCLLEDDAAIEERLKALFAASAVTTEYRGAAVIYKFAGRIPGAGDRGQEAVVQVVIKLAPDAPRELSARVEFKGNWELTSAAFQEIWQAEQWPILPPHHPDPRNYGRYTVPGSRVGAVSLTRDDNGRLLTWSYWDEPPGRPVPTQTSSALFCSNACRAPAWTRGAAAHSCPANVSCGEAAAK
ncbi:hypothetical protein [Massilia sp. YMA4]|uniref:hypothetical protein n=1 Tax=Massilia sp. YMA4 TaxID=1593482 RepID=UPI000DD113FD|nr:hypothetical protein [Massilia sp. YMA4]AXA92735.1 hypothetical protein DPH57_17220 [Massilia sp. YMA4]